MKRILRTTSIAGIFLVFVAQLFSPALTHALEFNPSLIISDAELTHAESMDANAIQKFLEYKGSYLARYRTTDIDGVEKTAAQIIYDAATRSRINPRYILALLQKEQSLIDGVPARKLQERLAWAAGYGICDACRKDDPLLQKYKGFAVQVDYAAGANRFYLDNPNKFAIKVGQATVIDGITVTPRNQATANQYIYTPHLAGNKNLWRIWHNWFTRRYPNGTVLQTKGDIGVWLIRDGAKHLFATKSAFLSRYSSDEIVTVEPSELENYENGKEIRFPNYSLVRLKNGLVYLLIDETKRPFSSQDIIRSLGYNPDEIIEVENNDEVRMYKTGKFITIKDTYPTGAVLKNRDTGELYYVHQGERRVIASASVAKITFPDRVPITVDSKTLANFPLKNQPVMLRDGTLVRTPNSSITFIISDGRRRLIPSKEVFEGLGYKESAVKEIDEQTLLLHPKGEPVYLNTNNVEAATK